MGFDVFTAGQQIATSVNINEGDDGENQGGQRGWAGWAPYALLRGKDSRESGLVTLDSASSIPPSRSADNQTKSEILEQLQGVSRAAWRDQHPQGGCRYSYHDDLLDWERAEAACVKRGGHLASLHGESDWSLLQALTPDGRAVHLGAKGITCSRVHTFHGVRNIDVPDPTCGWAWSDGSPWDWTFWGTGQPGHFTDAALCDSEAGARCVGLPGNLQCDAMPPARQLATGTCGWMEQSCSSAPAAYVCGFSCGESVHSLANRQQLDVEPRLESRVHLTNQRLKLRHLSVAASTLAHGGGGRDLGVCQVEDHSQLTIDYVTFQGNEQAGSGAGAIFASSSVVDVRFAAFTANKMFGSLGAAVIYATSSNVSIQNTVISDNLASPVADGHAAEDNSRRRLQRLQLLTGAAIASAIITVESSVVVSHSRLAANGGGPLLLAIKSTVSVARTDFDRNTGGDVIIAADCTELQLTGTTFTENRVLEGTAAQAAASRAPVSVLAGSSATVSETTFSGKVGVFAGAIFVAGGTWRR